MTAQQANYQIEQALADCSFEGFDICHQLAQVHEDYENGSLEKDSVDHEVESILEDGDIGAYLVNKIKERLVTAIQSED